MMLKPGKWYGAKLSENRIVPSLERHSIQTDELVSSTIPTIKPLGMYVEPQWVCQGKSYTTRAFLPEVNERPKNTGPIRYFEFHAFLTLDNTMMWLNHEHINRLEELDAESFKERLGCNNPQCNSWPLDGGTTAWGTALIGDQIVNACLICADLHRKALKARGLSHIKVLPEHPIEVPEPVSGL